MINACNIHEMWSISESLPIFENFNCFHQCELIAAKTEEVEYLIEHIYHDPGSVISTFYGLSYLILIIAM